MKIILASISPIRKEMLRDSGLAFEAVPPLCDEDIIKAQKRNLKFSDLALELAKAKAESISLIQRDSYVIGSDQICEFEGRAISKSRNEQEAFACLRMLSGKTHIQNNGTCIYLNGRPVMESRDKAILTMKELSDTDIWDYIKKDNPIGCAGSYKYELNGKYLFSHIEGSEECIKGFGIGAVIAYFSGIS
jgi:septum formation protein